MTAKTNKPRPDPFCHFAEWHGCLSEEDQLLPEAKWLEWSRAGKWCVYIKISGQRSKAWFRKSDIHAHFCLRYGIIRPDLVQKLRDLDDGFAPVPLVRDYTRNSNNIKRRVKS